MAELRVSFFVQRMLLVMTFMLANQQTTRDGVRRTFRAQAGNERVPQRAVEFSEPIVKRKKYPTVSLSFNIVATTKVGHYFVSIKQNMLMDLLSDQVVPGVGTSGF